ncbi:MAG: PDDEXK nuclease domain-containing protein [Phycisphaerales bacterium]
MRPSSHRTRGLHFAIAQHACGDPYRFDVLGTASPRKRELVEVLVEEFQRSLIELGSGIAFVGRQVHLEAGERTASPPPSWSFPRQLPRTAHDEATP